MNPHKLPSLPASFWFTGLSGSGKTTLATHLKERLIATHPTVPTVILDGDHLRSGLCADLGFSQEDRTENIRRTAEVARLFLLTGFTVIVACITPLNSQRALARKIITQESAFPFYLCWLKCSFDTCAQRDVKGLYARSKQDASIQLTGKGSAFEEPLMPEYTLDTEHESIEVLVNKLLL